MHSRPGQTDLQIDPSFQLASQLRLQMYTLNFKLPIHKNDFVTNLKDLEMMKVTSIVIMLLKTQLRYADHFWGDEGPSQTILYFIG